MNTRLARRTSQPLAIAALMVLSTGCGGATQSDLLAPGDGGSGTVAVGHDAASSTPDGSPGHDAASAVDAAPVIDAGPPPPMDAGNLDSCTSVCDDVGIGTCTAAGVCVITCAGNQSCDANVQCPPNVACRVLCQGTDSCSSDIVCAASSSCEVQCTGPRSCAGDITCDADSCSMTCSGSNSCNGQLTCQNGKTCTVSCGSNTCNGGVCCHDNNCNLGDQPNGC